MASDLESTPTTDDLALFKYYENTGTASSPQFAAPVQNPFGLSSPNNLFLFIDAADLDDDGDLDVLGGEDYGTFLYFENSTALGANTKNLEDNVQLDLSPNPVQSELTIQTDVEFERIEIFNTSGKLIKTYTGTETSIQLGTWSSGIYLIRFVDQDGNSLTRKIQKE